MLGKPLVIPPEAMEEFQPYVKIYKIAKKMNEGKVEKQFQKMMKLPLINSEEGIYHVMRTITANIRKRAKDSPLQQIFELCEQNQNEGNYLHMFKPMYIKHMFRPTENCIFYRNTNDFSLMRSLINSGTFTYEEVIPYIKRFYEEHISMPNIIILLYLYFGELIKEKDADFFASLKAKCVSFNGNSKMNGSLWSYFEEFIDFPPKLNEYITYGVAKESVMYMLKYDDVESLMMWESIDSDVNMVIKNNVLDFPSYIQQSPTLIQYATYYGSVKCFKYLMMKGASLDAKDNWGHSIKDFAIISNCIELIKIIEQSGRNFSDSLASAAESGKREVFDWIMRTQKADNNKVKKTLQSTFCSACSMNNPEMLLYCLEQGVEINYLDEKGFTPLNCTVIGQFLPFMKFLLAIPGTNVNLQDIDGESPLHCAAKHNYINIVKYLLEREEIDVTLVDHFGKTPFDKAIQANSLDTADYMIQHPKIINVLKETNPRAAISTAVIHQNKNSLTFLLKHPEFFDLNAPVNNMSFPPIVYLAEKGNKELVELLLSFPHIDPNAREQLFGMNFLQAAVRQKQSNIVEIGLNNEKVDKLTPTKFGRTLLFLAGDDEQIKNMIIEYASKASSNDPKSDARKLLNAPPAKKKAVDANPIPIVITV